jgi:hypothetical protein
MPGIGGNPETISPMAAEDTILSTFCILLGFLFSLTTFIKGRLDFADSLQFSFMNIILSFMNIILCGLLSLKNFNINCF